MDLRTDTVNGTVTVVAVDGDVDMSTAPQLEERLSALSSGGARNLIIDLTDVEFLDSSALGVLVGIHKQVSAAGGTIKLVCGHPRIERIFAITRLTEVIPVFESIDAATRTD
ncbi:MAG TPA: STAS domain-containing protein [Jatrophihabitantaceae bacterium]|nr:STAS domain-containing protein [Jatrophihabitantaceae bacterium]